MSEHGTEDIARHVKVYITVFVALLVLTLVTVAVSYLHFPIAWAILFAMLIASVKGSLVACFFMHLISERKLIYSLLAATVFFFIALMLLPMLDMNTHAAIGGA